MLQANKNLKKSLLPDTSIVKDAIDLLGLAADSHIYNHSLRTHYLASKFAEKNKMNVDKEQLALACLFHDIGLCEHYYSPHSAFVFNSSESLKDFLIEKDYPKSRIRPMMEAIDFHFSITPKWSLGDVAGLLQIGAWMDVTGIRTWALPGERKRARALFNDDGFFLKFNVCLIKQLLSPKRAVGIVSPQMVLPQGHYDLTSHCEH